jgi:uncharacterized small protein (DUF1192 family)
VGPVTGHAIIPLFEGYGPRYPGGSRAIAALNDEESRSKKQVFIEQSVLDPRRVTDLHAMMAVLRAEIARAEAAIAAEQGARGHAESFFTF